MINAYDGEKLIGTGRAISDGVTNAYICGVVMDPIYQGQGIGIEIMKQLKSKKRECNLHLQLSCTDEMIPYYEKLGFEVFASGMKAI